MKQKLSIIMILLAIIFVSQACKKEEAVKQDDKNNNEVIYGAQGGGDNTEAKIINFFNRMKLVRENPKYPESEKWNYKKDSTIWYIEAALNYKYAFRWQYSGNTEHSDMYNIDSSFVSLNTNSSGDFNIIALQMSFDAFEASLKSQYESIEDDNKFFVISDILNRGFENNKLKLKQYSVIGKANKSFSSGDWKWGLGLGDCSGNNVGLDAADIIENKLSSNRVYLYDPNGIYYYDNINILPLGQDGYIIPMAVSIPASQNPTAFNNFKIFRNPYSTGDVCLSNADINWYTNNILSIENNYTPNGEHIVFDDIIDERYYPNGGTTPIANRHKLQPHYGVLKFRVRTTPID